MTKLFGKVLKGIYTSNSTTLVSRERILTLSTDEAFWAKVASFFRILIFDLSDLISAEYLASSSIRDVCSEINLNLSSVLDAFNWLILFPTFSSRSEYSKFSACNFSLKSIISELKLIAVLNFFSSSCSYVLPSRCPLFFISFNICTLDIILAWLYIRKKNARIYFRDNRHSLFIQNNTFFLNILFIPYILYVQNIIFLYILYIPYFWNNTYFLYILFNKLFRSIILDIKKYCYHAHTTHEM